jgi:hypothetical protein
MNLTDEEQEVVFYAKFINQISGLSEERQTELKEEYKEVYEDMLARREEIMEQQRIQLEKYPNSIPRSFANYYCSGNFGVYWGAKMIVYEP